MAEIHRRCAAVCDDSLSVSPDGRWLLYTQADEDNADIMLVENFR